MKLLIDMGNSRVKWRLREDGHTLASGKEGYAGSWAWLAELGASYRVQHVWVSSVAGAAREQALQSALDRLGMPVAQFAETRPQALGLQCGYRDWRSLGVDRWLAMIGARSLIPGALVVVDSGTAITVDRVSAEGVHEGGWIAPGVGLMRKALAGESDALAAALSEPFKAQHTLGTDTRSAIDGAICAMGRGLIEAALGAGSAALLLTGGDAAVWQAWYPEARWEPELVLSGLEYYIAAQ